MPRASLRAPVAGLLLFGLTFLGMALDRGSGWFTHAFEAVAHLFYEKSPLAELREPSQLALARAHVPIVCILAALGLIASPWLSRHQRVWIAIFLLGYAIRAAFWIAGGNLPLVPGDSSHYVEVATSVYRGAGPVKHYVESFFVDYTKHGFNTAGFVLDDWATPLWAYILAFCYRITGVVPGANLETTFAVAKSASFVVNLAALPVLYAFSRRAFDKSIALTSMALLAVLPVHALYAGFALRESAVALVSLLAVWGFWEMQRATTKLGLGWAVLAGLFAGLAILARNTSLVLVACMGVYALAAFRPRKYLALIIWGIVALGAIAPWAWATWREYGEPFFTYTKYYPFNFSWTVHHFDKGNTRPDQFFHPGNAWPIARVKFKSFLIVWLYSTMILGAPLALAFLFKLCRPAPPEGSPRGMRSYSRFVALVFAAFLAATLIQISDVTQVQQLGRYYLPVFVLMMPVAASGLLAWGRPRLTGAGWLACALVVVGALWSNPTWAHDASWFLNPYQLRWPAIRAAGDWIRENPQQVPPNARVMTWFPWELRVASDRSTVLFPRALEGGAYELRRIQETIQRYRVTHILWGSFEPGQQGEPEAFGDYLRALRESLGLTDTQLLWKSERLPHAVRLYRVPGGSP